MPRWIDLISLALAVVPAAVLGQANPSASIAYRTFQSLVISEWCASGPNVCISGTPDDQIAGIRNRVSLHGTLSISGLPLSPDSVQSVYASIAPSLRDSLETELITTSLVPSSTFGLGLGALGSKMVTGLTEFLLQRARDEVVQSAFRDLDRLFENNRDLATVFPNLHATIRIDDLSFRALIPALRAAGEADLRKLPQSIADSGLSFWAGNVPWEVQTVALVAERATDVMMGVPFEESVAQLADLSSGQLGHEGVRTAFRLFGMLGREAAALQLAHSDSPNFAKWVGNVATAPIDRMFENETIRRVFLTILLHDLGTEGLDNLLGSADRAVDRVLEAYTRVRGIETLVQQNRNNATKLDVLLAVSEAFDLAAELVPADVRPSAERVLATARAMRRMFEDGESWQVLLVVLNAIPETDSDADEALSKLKRIATLAAVLADASSSDEVTLALEAWADPVGSYRERRRNGVFQVSVVSYVGMGGGSETVRDVMTDTSVTGGFTGMFVPVGLELSYGLGKASVGLLASMVDLGTVASLRLSGLDVETATDTLTVSTAAEFGLQQVFAPSAWLTLGVGTRYPLALCFGFEYAPHLRTVEGNGATVEQNVLRLGLFMGVDLTLFRF